MLRCDPIFCILCFLLRRNSIFLYNTEGMMADKKDSVVQRRMKNNWIPALCRLGIALLFVACFTFSGLLSAARVVSNLQTDTGSVEFDFIPEDDEKVYSRRIASLIEEESDVLEDESLNGYLERIGEQIIDRNNLRDLIGDWEWSFKILDSSDVNAFAALGGQVYLCRGLVEMAESESELAAILSFELGHIMARHIYRHLYEQLIRQTDFSSGEKLTGEEGWEKLTALFMAEEGISAFFSDIRYNSLQVERADELVLLYNYNAEFNPQAFLTLLERLERRERPQPDWLKRNSLSQRRKRKISSSLKLLPSLTSPLTHTRFYEFKARLDSHSRPSFYERERQPGSDQEILLDVTVMGDTDWTDTGVEVYEGQEVAFSAFGTVYLQEGNIKAYCGPEGYDLRTRQQPFTDGNIGALIGKVVILLAIEIDEGSGREIRHEIREKFFIGSENRIRMPMSGELYLGINENLVGDNTGAFSVSIVYSPIRFFPFL